MQEVLHPFQIHNKIDVPKKVKASCNLEPKVRHVLWDLLGCGLHFRFGTTIHVNMGPMDHSLRISSLYVFSALHDKPTGHDCFCRQENGKSSYYFPQLLRKYVFPSWTLKPGKPPPWTFKTVRFTFLAGYKRFSNAVLFSFSNYFGWIFEKS